jgi:sterol desaturase/sphingolipid hydroxylase (fatty acid hydroxylase superfamily)
MEYILHYFAWNFCIYWVHRIVHKVEWTNHYHWDHHKYIIANSENRTKNPTGWHWNNLFFYNDTWKSTVDLWITEVIPTLIYSAITGQWWILLMYWVWAAFLQERVEHNPDWHIPYLSAGKWHLVHHWNSKKNFGLHIPLWDKLFGTHKSFE